MFERQPQKSQMLNFVEACQQLQISDEHLISLVSEGELRAYRSGEGIKFRADDIENVRVELASGSLKLPEVQRSIIPQVEGWCSFEEALSILKLTEADLLKIISDGEIRAFRSGVAMKFRADDIESVREELANGALRLPEVQRDLSPRVEGWCSVEQALKLLQITEADLLQIISDGEIRAFRSGVAMKFRADDVESLKEELARGALRLRNYRSEPEA